MGGTESVGLTKNKGPLLSTFAMTVRTKSVTQSLGNNSVTMIEQRRFQSPLCLLDAPSKQGLPCIPEVEIQEKTEPLPLSEPLGITEVDGRRNKGITVQPPVSDFASDCVTEPIETQGMEGSPRLLGVEESELEERIKKLREEAAEYDRVKKLRQEAIELERINKFRGEAAELELQMELRKDGKPSDLDDNILCTKGLSRVVIKVPQPPPLPPINKKRDSGPSKRKTRSDIAAELATKEVEAGKKKPKKTKKNQRIIPLG